MFSGDERRKDYKALYQFRRNSEAGKRWFYKISGKQEMAGDILTLTQTYGLCKRAEDQHGEPMVEFV